MEEIDIILFKTNTGRFLYNSFKYRVETIPNPLSMNYTFDSKDSQIFTLQECVVKFNIDCIFIRGVKELLRVGEYITDETGKGCVIHGFLFNPFKNTLQIATDEEFINCISANQYLKPYYKLDKNTFTVEEVPWGKVDYGDENFSYFTHYNEAMVQLKIQEQILENYKE